LSAAPGSPRAQARIPGTNEHTERSRGAEPPSREGPQAPRRRGLQEVAPGPMHLAGEGSAADPTDGVTAPSEGFPPSARLKRRQEFLRVQREGTRVHTPHYVVVVLRRPEGDDVRRLGITVTKKVAGAVGRNRVKRVVREVFR